MPHPPHQLRTDFEGLVRYLLATLAVVGLVQWPGAGQANQGERFAPQIIIIVDESGSMKGRHRWLIEALPGLGQALVDRNRYDLPDAVEFTVAGFTSSSHELVEQASPVQAADAVSHLRTNGGIEDGYVAIREVLDAHPKNAGGPITVILISDEDRDITDPSLSFESMSSYLAMNGAVLHVVGLARIRCPNQRAGIAVDENGVALRIGTDGLSSCENATAQVVGDYAELAWATGGLIWDLEKIATRPRRQNEPFDLEQLIAGLSDRILMQWPATLSARVGYSPAKPRAGDVVTFDASKSFKGQNDSEAVKWVWDLDGDNAADEFGPVIARSFPKPGQHRIELLVTDNSTPPVTSRKVLYVQIAE